MKGQGRRSPKVFLIISRRRIVVESRDSCKNVGEINITFWSVTYDFQDRPGQSSDLHPIENEKNRILNVRPARLCNPSDCSCFIRFDSYTHQDANMSKSFISKGHFTKTI